VRSASQKLGIVLIEGFHSHGVVMEPTILLFILASVAILALFYQKWKSHDVKEPPWITPKVPIVGHAIGVFRHGVQYYTKHRFIPLD
jgi:hypothetical protein